MEFEFLKVSLDIVREHGTDVALFYSYLKFVNKKIQKDDHGYFRLDANYIFRGLGWERGKFRHIRDLAVKAHLIDYIGGSNQNEKPRYKII